MKEWNLSVPTGEEIVCIACSNSLICLGTTAYFIRVCSVFGIQKAIFSVPGPIVAMSAQNDCLMVAYHVAAPKNKDQSIDLCLVTFNGEWLSVVGFVFTHFLCVKGWCLVRNKLVVH